MRRSQISKEKKMSGTTEVSFIKALFDFQLRHFITLRVLRVLYTISALLVVIGGAIIMLASLINGGSQALLTIIFTPLGVLIYLILIRLWIETLANLQRIGDNTQKTAERG
jgi:hypothetical protein